MIESFEDARDPGATTIREILSRTVETVAFELKTSDAAVMGWPIAWQMAMWLAAQGEGLVDADGEWWKPTSLRGHPHLAGLAGGS